MTWLRPWILLFFTLALPSASLAGGGLTPAGGGQLPACVYVGVNQAGMIAFGSSPPSGGGAMTGGPVAGGGLGGPGGETGYPDGDGDPSGPIYPLPWGWYDEHPPFFWDETLPFFSPEPDGNDYSICASPASVLSVTIEDPEDPHSTPYSLQDLAGRIVATGSDLLASGVINTANDWSNGLNLDDMDFEVEDVPLEPGSNSIAVWALNDAGALVIDFVEVIRHDDYCDARQGNVICTEFWCDGGTPLNLIQPQYRTWLEEHPDGIGILYPMHGEFPPATDLPPAPAEPLDAALTYSVFQEGGQNKLRFHAELRSFDSLATPFKLNEVAVLVTTASENGETSFTLDPFCYDAAQGFYDVNGAVFGYVDAIIPFDGSNNGGAPNTVTATLISVDGSGDQTGTIGSDRSTFIPNDKPVASTDPVPNGLVAQINDSGLNVVDNLLASQVSAAVKDGLANPPPNDDALVIELNVGSVGFSLRETGALVPTVSLQDLSGIVRVSNFLGYCFVSFLFDSASVAVRFNQVPASDPHQVDLVPGTTTTSAATPQTSKTGSLLLCPLVNGGDVANQVMDVILAAIADGLEPTIEDQLNGLGLGQVVADLLQVEFDGTFSSIDDLTAMARYNVDSHFQATSGNTLVTQSFNPTDEFAPFGTSAPGGVGAFDLGVYLSAAGLNQLLAARTNDGLLSTELTELTPGEPLDVGALAVLGVGFPGGAQADDPVVLEITPTLAPMTNGQPGPDGEMYQLDIRQLVVKALWTDAQGAEVEVIRLSVDLSLGLDISFAGPGAPPATELGEPTAVAKVLYNPFESTEWLVELIVGGLFSEGFGDLVGDVFGDGGGGPIGFLGLDVNGEGALRAGNSAALLFDLAVAPTQANISVDQDGIEDISVGFTVTFPFDGVSFAWDFDDGDTQTTTSPSVNHIFGGLPGNGGLPPGLHTFGVTVDVTRSNGAVVSGVAPIAICIKEAPDDVCEQ